MNKIVLMGRLTNEPEVRYTQSSNQLVSKFTLAVNRNFVKQGEERQADFINCVAWNKTGEFVSKYFHKGQQVAVIGRLQIRTWEDEEDKKHYVTEVIVEETYFADSIKNEETDMNTILNSTNVVNDNTLKQELNKEDEMVMYEGDDLPF